MIQQKEKKKDWLTFPFQRFWLTYSNLPLPQRSWLTIEVRGTLATGLFSEVLAGMFPTPLGSRDQGHTLEIILINASFLNDQQDEVVIHNPHSVCASAWWRCIKRFHLQSNIKDES